MFNLRLDFHPIPWVIYPEILIISPCTSTANMKTKRKIYLRELFFLCLFQSKEMAAVKLLNEKNSVCQQSS